MNSPYQRFLAITAGYLTFIGSCFAVSSIMFFGSYEIADMGDEIVFALISAVLSIIFPLLMGLLTYQRIARFTLRSTILINQSNTDNCILSKKNRYYLSISIALVLITFFLGDFVIKYLGHTVFTPLAIISIILLPLTISFITYWLGARLIRHSIVRRNQNHSENVILSKKLNYLLYIFITLFMITWLFGAPAVQTYSHDEDIKLYNSAVASGHSMLNKPYPGSDISACFPLFPGILACYKEYQFGPVWGWAGWELHGWYIFGSKRLYSYTIMVS